MTIALSYERTACHGCRDSITLPPKTLRSSVVPCGFLLRRKFECPIVLVLLLVVGKLAEVKLLVPIIIGSLPFKFCCSHSEHRVFVVLVGIELGLIHSIFECGCTLCTQFVLLLLI